MATGSLDRLNKRAASLAKPAGNEIDVPLNKVKFDPKQPRQAYHHIDGRVSPEDEKYIEELAASIEANGQIELPTYQAMPDGSYLVVVGECRTRAHLFLGRQTIRVIVRNDLTSRAKRLLFQLAENVNRRDLSEDEMAGSIKELMTGADGEEPMNQTEIAAYFGKSEGWVTRYVKFGDEEQQRMWVRPGIADTVEKVYRLSILPKTVQIDILRRVDLPDGHPEKLVKPLNRNTIDDLARDAKLQRNQASITIPTAPASIPASTKSSAASSIEEAAQESMRKDAGGSGADAIPTGGYALSEADRASLLGSMPADTGGAKGARESVAPPVNCRINLTNVRALLAVLISNPEIAASLESVRCDLSIPAPIAKQFASELMGIVVDDQQLSSTLQNEISKLK